MQVEDKNLNCHKEEPTILFDNGETGISLTLYVGNSDSDINENFLFKIFNPIGSVASINLCRNIITH